MCHPVCSVSATPSKARLIGFCNKWRTPVHCHREKHQGFTSLYSAVSHSVNEVRQLAFKRKHARWFYRTQADACGSRAIEWFWRLSHRCWFPLPTYRISCDAGSDNLLGRICHPVCSVSATPSKARLIGFGNGWKLHSIATERSIRVSLRSTQLFLTVSMRLENTSTNDDLLDGSIERRLTLAEVEPSDGFGSCLTEVGPHFRLFVFHAMPEVTTFWGDVPSVLLRVCNTKQSSADRLLQQAEKSCPLP